MSTTPSTFNSSTLQGLAQALRVFASAVQEFANATDDTNFPPLTFTSPNTAAATESTGTHPDDLALQILAKNMFLSADIRRMPWYVVTRGKVPGIYLTPTEVDANVVGVSLACSRKCGSQAEALVAYRESWRAGEVRISEVRVSEAE